MRSSPQAHPVQAGERPTIRQAEEGAAAIGNFFQNDVAKTSPDKVVAPAVSAAERAANALPGRLNLFQATMLDWRDLHPYNAVHAVVIEQSLNADALTAAIAAELSRAGLTGLVLDRTRCRYAWRGGPAQVCVETIEPGASWQASLVSTFERHLNAPFAREGRIDPFRFFAIPTGDTFFLGLAYDHFIAGGDSIVVLLNAIVDRYAGRPAQNARMQLYPRTHAHLFLRHPWRFVLGLARLPGLAASCRRTIRPRYAKIEDGHNAFTFFFVAPAQFLALRNAAKGWGVTLNDAVMALLLLAQDAVIAPRDASARRHELAVASIINLRSAHGEDTRATFGQFLSSFRLSHPVPRGITLYELACDVHQAASRIKREKLFLTTLFAMAVDRILGRRQTPLQRMSVYAKNYPVGAGVSSLNIDTLWQRTEGAPAPTYIRGVPTGPLSPIVVAVTASGGRLCLGVSYRTTAISQDGIATLRDDILRRIDALS